MSPSFPNEGVPALSIQSTFPTSGQTIKYNCGRWALSVSDPNLRSSTWDCQRLRGFKALKRNSLRRSFVLTQTLAHPGKRYSGKFGGKRWASRWTVSLQFLLRGWSFGEAWPARLWSRVRATISGTPEQICGNQQNWPPSQRAHFHPQHHGGKKCFAGWEELQMVNICEELVKGEWRAYWGVWSKRVDLWSAVAFYGKWINYWEWLNCTGLTSHYLHYIEEKLELSILFTREI